MSLLIALGGAARRGSQMIREAQEEERKKAELKELRSYQREQLQEQREYQKGLLQEEREYQSEVRVEDRLFRESQAEKNRAFQAGQAAIARKTAAQVRAEANAMALARAGISGVDYDNPEEVAKAVEENKLKAQAQANAAKIAEENRKAELESAQKISETALEQGAGVFTATEYLAMDDEERARVGKLIGSLDSMYLPADQFGFAKLRRLDNIGNGEGINNPNQAALMDFSTINWSDLSTQYSMSTLEQKRNILNEIKKRAGMAELYSRQSQRDDAGNIVSDARNLIEIYGDVLEGTPFYDIVREGVLGIPAPRDEVTGELLLPGGGSAQVPPAANAPAKVSGVDPADFTYGLIMQSPNLTVTNIDGETQVPLQYFSAIETMYNMPGISDAIQNPKVSIMNSISDFNPGQKKQLAFTLNAASKNPNSPMEAIEILAAADQEYVPKMLKKPQQILEPFARQLLSTEIMQERIKAVGGDIFAAAEATVTSEENLQKELTDLKKASSIGVGVMREGAMLVRGLRGQVDQAFSNDKTSLDYLESERKAIIGDYMKAYDPEDSKLSRAEYRKVIEEELMVGTSYADMDEELVMDGIYRLLRERLAYSLVKTLDPSGRISDRDRESGLSQLGIAGFVDVKSAAAAADYLLADSTERLLRAKPFVGRVTGNGVVYDERNIRLARATATFYNDLKNFDTKDYRQPYNPEIHNYVTLDDGRMFMTDSDGAILFEESGGIELVKNPRMNNKIVRKDSLRGMYDPNRNKPASPAPTTTDSPESASMFNTGISAKDMGLEGNGKVMIDRKTGTFFVDGVDVTRQIPQQTLLNILKSIGNN